MSDDVDEGNENDGIQLIGDDDGIAVIGEPSAVERFLRSEGIESRKMDLRRLTESAGRAARVADAGATALAESGRWVKLTKQSAHMLKKHGPMPTKTPGINHAMIGDPGKIQRWLQMEGGLGQQLTNPAVLSGAAGIMAQLAMEQSMAEITDYLATIDRKVDEILRAQKDTVHSKIIGVDMIIDDALTVRNQVGRVSETTWSTVQGTSLAIAETQAYAVRQLEALADKVEEAARINELASISKQAESEAGEWLQILAHSFRLQDAAAILELDRVLDASADELDEHRLGLKTARENRTELIIGITGQLLERMALATERANSKVLFNPRQSPAVIASANKVTTDVLAFRDHLGFTADDESFDARAWREAATEAKDLALEKGAQGVKAARRFGGRSLGRAASLTARLAERVADRVNPDDENEPEAET